MLGPTQSVLAYYLGGGFVILLAWAACHPDRRLDHAQTRRYLRWSVVVAAVGLVHPAAPFAARDIVGQVGADLPTDDHGLVTRHRRTRRTVDLLAVLSLLPVAVLLFVRLVS